MHLRQTARGYFPQFAWPNPKRPKQRWPFGLRLHDMPFPMGIGSCLRTVFHFLFPCRTVSPIRMAAGKLCTEREGMPSYPYCRAPHSLSKKQLLHIPFYFLYEKQLLYFSSLIPHLNFVRFARKLSNRSFIPSAFTGIIKGPLLSERPFVFPLAVRQGSSSSDSSELLRY